MGQRGGARKGAGRKPGPLKRQSKEVAQRLSANGVSPLEVIVKAMLTHYDAGRYDEAAGFAKDAAPYCHPKLTAVEVTGVDDGPVEVKHTTDFAALRAKWRDRVKPDGR